MICLNTWDGTVTNDLKKLRLGENETRNRMASCNMPTKKHGNLLYGIQWDTLIDVRVGVIILTMKLEEIVSGINQEKEREAKATSKVVGSQFKKLPEMHLPIFNGSIGNYQCL